VNEIEDVLQNPVSRRAFLARMSAAGLGGVAMTLLAGCGSGAGSRPNPNPNPSPTPTPGGSFFDPVNFPNIPGRNINEVVLNYALTLEILEADLYRQALNLASGRSINAALDPTLPTGPTGTGAYTRSISAGGLSGAAADAAFLYLVQFAYVEAAHRDFLDTALQSFGAPRATRNPAGYTAAFGNNLQSIMELLYVVEEVGVRAYLGAAGFMTINNATEVNLLTTAVAIHSTEARHSGAVGYILGKQPGPLFSGADRNPVNQVNSPNPAPFAENTFQYFLQPTDVLNTVQPFFL
jgi:hypothetical protein